jgi:hypothetical protein
MTDAGEKATGADMLSEIGTHWLMEKLVCVGYVFRIKNDFV